MENLREILDEIHLYTNKLELLIKDIIWGLSWICGIYAIHNTSDKRALSSSYFIFSLSMLMEFGEKIKKKEHWASRLIDGIFCVAIIEVLLLAAVYLFGAPGIKNHFDIMYKTTFGIMCFMGIDFVIAWIEPNIEFDIKKVDDKKSTNEIKDIQLANIFRQKLLSGNLGNVKGDDDNE